MQPCGIQLLSLHSSQSSKSLGNEVKLGPFVNDEGKTAQEYLELIKLKFEQVGFSNPTVWVGKLVIESESSTSHFFKVPAMTPRQRITSLKTQRVPHIHQLPPFHSLGSLYLKSLDPDQAKNILDTRLRPSLTELLSAIREKDAGKAITAQEMAASSLADLRALQVPKRKLPYVIPEEYSSLPRLLGRYWISDGTKSLIVLSEPRWR